MVNDLIFRFFIAAILSYVSAFVFRKLAFKFNVVDHPSEDRKIHADSMPLMGGVAIVFSFICSLSLGIGCSFQVLLLILGGLIIFLINLIDDARGLSARFRFVAEVLISLLIILFADARISFLPAGHLGDITEIFITLIWFVGMINAVNYLDGLDGLASGMSAICAAFFCGMLLYTRQFELGAIALVVVGSCLGFLPHNFPKAKMFLGDAGSTFLGFMLAGFGVMGNWAAYDVVRLAAPILVLGVPIFDMTFTTVMRIRDGKVHNVIEWMRYSGRDHFHHSLIDIGFTRNGATYFIWVVCVVLGLSALLVRKNMDIEAFIAVFQAGLIFWMIGALLVIGRRKRSGWEEQ